MVKKAAQAIPNKLLRAARQERGWTQQQLADLIGAPQPLNVTRWERGVAFPSAYYTQKLAQVFEKSPRDLGLLPPEEESDEQQEHVPTGMLWQVPYRHNPFFTGREDVLQLLRHQLRSESSVALTQASALTGLGGIGKTQTALEYAYRYWQDYLAVFWARAASRETLVADYAALARLLELPESDAADQNQVVESVKRWLLTHPGWLLVLDNVEDLALVADFVPTSGQGHLLITTRAQASGKIALGLVVEKMDTEEACLLLLRRARHLGPTDPLAAASLKEREAALAIAQEFDGLPLALDQAGAYMEEVGSSLREYLLLYQRHSRQLLERQSTFDHDYPYTVANTWSLSFRQVEQASPAAADLLRLCAFLAPDAIPETILNAGAASLGPALSPVAADTLLLHEAIGVLRRYSLLKRNAETHLVSVHRLVQTVLKDTIDAQAHRYWAERTVRAVYEAFPEPRFEHWRVCELCLPHALLAAELIEQYQFSFSETWRLLERLGCYLRDRGQYRQAESLLQRGLAMCEQVEGTEHLNTAALLSSLQELYYLQGRYTQAESLTRRAVEIREQALGPEHSSTAEAYSNLAFACVAQGKYEQAEPLYQHALLILEHVLGPQHPDIAAILNNLGELYQAQGKYEQAESHYQHALLINERLFGPEHSEVAISLTCLGYLSMVLGNYERAESLHQRALTIFSHTVGPDHPYTGRVLNNLGELYQTAGQQEQAESFYRQALAIYEQSLDEHHPHVLRTLDHLAALSGSQGQQEQAQPLLHHTRAMHEQVPGLEHPDTVSKRTRSTSLQEQSQQASQRTSRESQQDLAKSSPPPPSRKSPSYAAGLTAREVEVVRLAAQGLTNAQIAERLALSEKTVINHLTRMFKKIGCRNRATAVAFAIRHGIT